MSYSVQNLSDVLESGGEEFAKASGFVKFDSRESVEKGKTVVYDQLFLFLK